MAYLGGLYRFSSKEDSFKWFYAAAEKGLSSAQSEVGSAYEFGSGTAQSYPLAFEWYSKAAAQDDIEAQARLGFLHESGLGIPIDLSEARRYYRLAARQGSIVGATPLADEILAEHPGQKGTELLNGAD
jgi:TPR repeat protein